MATPEQAREYYFKNREKRLVKRKEYVQENYDKVRQADKEYKKKNYLALRLSRYGLSVEHYQVMLDAQNNKCKICEHSFDKTPHVDHCHTSGIVRGLLCDKCNVGLGSFKDNPENLEKAANYLRRFVESESQ